MTMKKTEVEFTPSDLKQLRDLVSSGAAKARVIRRANILLMIHRGLSRLEIVKASGIGVATVGRIKRSFLTAGLQAAIFDGVRTGRPLVFGEAAQKKILALSRRKPPRGKRRWSLSLLIQHFQGTRKPTKNTVSLLLRREGIHLVPIDETTE
jgi:putative transposase